MTRPSPDPASTAGPSRQDLPESAQRIHGSQRSDAQRNRQRILAAARELYATRGLGVSMATVAREAGVGKATLSRHFASPHDLIDAVFLDHMDDYVRVTSEALTIDDPWQGFITFISSVCRLQADNRGFADVLTLTLRGDGAMERRRLEGYRGFLTLIEGAKATGHLRVDFVSEDLVLLLMANAGLISATGQDAPDGWRRLVGQLLRAYAAPGAPLPPLPPAPTSELLFQAMARLGAHAGDSQLC